MLQSQTVCSVQQQQLTDHVTRVRVDQQVDGGEFVVKDKVSIWQYFRLKPYANKELYNVNEGKVLGCLREVGGVQPVTGRSSSNTKIHFRPARIKPTDIRPSLLEKRREDKPWPK